MIKETCYDYLEKVTRVRKTEKKTIGEKKPKIKWPKANETAVYKQFDEEVNNTDTMC